MKNPFKGLGDKLKDLRGKIAATRKHETTRSVVDGVGDGGIVSGIALIATAAFLPAAPLTVLAAGSLFIAAGAAAKYVAAKMKPDVYDVTKPPQEKPAPANDETPPSALTTKQPAPDFKNAVGKTQQAPAAKPAAKPGVSAPQP